MSSIMLEPLNIQSNNITTAKVNVTYSNNNVLLLQHLNNTNKGQIKIYLNQPVKNESGEEDNYMRSEGRNSEK